MINIPHNPPAVSQPIDTHTHTDFGPCVEGFASVRRERRLKGKNYSNNPTVCLRPISSQRTQSVDLLVFVFFLLPLTGSMCYFMQMSHTQSLGNKWGKRWVLFFLLLLLAICFPSPTTATFLVCGFSPLVTGDFAVAMRGVVGSYISRASFPLPVVVGVRMRFLFVGPF